MSPRKACIALVLAAAALSAGSAAADTLGLVVAGEPAKQPVIETTLDPWLRQAGHDVKLGPLDQAAVNQIVDCFILNDQRCAEATAAKAKLGGLLFVMVELKRDTKAQTDEIKLTGWLFDGNGSSVAAQSVFCKVCRNDTLGPTAEDLARTLFSLSASATGRVKIVTVPAGATVTIDGKPAGATPLEHGLRAGPHTVVLELSRHRTVTRQIEVNKGESSTLEITLQSVGVGGGGGRGLLPYVVMGGGAALLATGAVMFAIDQDCELGGPCDVPPTAPTYRDSATLGVALGAAGVVAIGVGVVLYLRGGSKKPEPATGPTAPPPDAQPAVTAAPWLSRDGAGLAVMGRF